MTRQFRSSRGEKDREKDGREREGREGVEVYEGGGTESMGERGMIRH